ncbi:hypothetical protein C7M84_022160 [Penaeus vannamei]|uniref:Uncharacterized protein n=1 Tax=Penaeus vannamei TaxID=6689 RepID=A0A3R7PF32_PENVA|nr:hypothetical protein C7M84_022160 [Penaeus vannamei]
MFRLLVLALVVAVDSFRSSDLQLRITPPSAPISAAAAQDPANCRCGAFITLDSVEKMLYELPPLDMGSCDQHNKCRDRCFKEFEELSGGGDLNYITSDGVTPVGQILCTASGKPVHNEYVYAYSELCDGPWEWTGDQTMQPLCCNKDHEYHPCPE